MSQTLLQPTADIPLTPQATLSQIVKQYLIVSLKLFNISEMVPEDEASANAIEKQEINLLDKQADLLSSALACKIESLEDAKATLSLWHHEVVKSQMPGSLSAADELVSSVCQYLDVA